MDYTREDLRQGQRLKMETEETTSSFGTNDGALHRNVNPNFGKSRMAGQQGERILQLMNDPAEAQRTAEWMQKFGMSNQGFEFNQAKMMMAAPPQAAPQQEQQ